MTRKRKAIAQDDGEEVFLKGVADAEKILNCLSEGEHPAIKVIDRQAAVALLTAIVITIERPGVGSALVKLIEGEARNERPE